MLTEKDYCDYETCVALKELGFSEPTLAYYDGFLPSKALLYLVIDEDCMPEYGVNVFDLLSNSNNYKDSKFIDAPTLWEAHKWLRKKHEIQVSVLPFEDCDTDADGNIVGRWVSYGFALQYTTTAMWIVNKGHTYDFDTINAQDTYEEALAEGIKEAVKILKDGNNS